MSKNTQNQAKFRERIIELIDIQNKKKEALSEKRNQSKVDNSLDVGQFVMIKNRQIVLGTSKKLSHKFEVIPYKITAKTKNGYYCTNLVTKSLVLRHYDDLKIIKISQNTDPTTTVPPEIATLLYSIDLGSLNEEFSIPSKQNPVKRKTRQQTLIEEEKNKLISQDLFNFQNDMDMEEFVSFSQNETNSQYLSMKDNKL